MLKVWASGHVVRELDCCAKHRRYEQNPLIIVGMLAHCPSSSKWVPGGNTREVKDGEERNWPPYLTMPVGQDKCLSNGHSPNVRNRIRDSPFCRSSLIKSKFLDDFSEKFPRNSDGPSNCEVKGDLWHVGNLDRLLCYSGPKILRYIFTTSSK